MPVPQTKQYNPAFMNPMLEAVRALIPEIGNAFRGSTPTESARLTPREQTLIQKNLSPLFSGRDPDKVIAEIESGFTRITEMTRSEYTHNFFTFALSGENRQLSAAAVTASVSHCKTAVLVKLADWGIKESSKAIDDAMSFTQLFSAVHAFMDGDPRRDVLKDIVRQTYQEQSAKYQEQGEVIVKPISPKERAEFAEYATQLLFKLGKELIHPGPNLFLIIQRNPELAVKLRDFFRTYHQQLNTVRNAQFMNDQTFEALR